MSKITQETKRKIDNCTTRFNIRDNSPDRDRKDMSENAVILNFTRHKLPYDVLSKLGKTGIGHRCVVQVSEASFYKFESSEDALSNQILKDIETILAKKFTVNSVEYTTTSFLLEECTVYFVPSAVSVASSLQMIALRGILGFYPMILSISKTGGNAFYLHEIIDATKWAQTTHTSVRREVLCLNSTEVTFV